jgi:hypothetical protein
MVEPADASEKVNKAKVGQLHGPILHYGGRARSGFAEYEFPSQN